MATTTETTQQTKREKTAAELIRIGDQKPIEKSPSHWSVVWKRFQKNKLAIYGFFVILVVTIIAILAPVISPYSPNSLEPLFNKYGGGGADERPSLKFPIGTDSLGRDLMSRIIWGSKISLVVGVVASLVSTIIGVVLGALAGYYRGLTEEIIMRITDMFLAVPFLLIAIVAVQFLRSGRIAILQNLNHSTIMISVLGLFGWAGLCRLVTAEVKRVMTLEYVQAAICLGASDWRIISRHVLPNILASIIVITTLNIGGNILAEAGLTYLGFGDPQTVSWGRIVNDGVLNLQTNPEQTFVAGFGIFFLVLAFNIVGDALRDAMDPRLKD
ncbi:MAG: ABC transporter permease [Candidatus Heimdallarchaeota archaeon]|nr:ABC transporter permease [Candidatus Heimdallarchaeota archaeon]